MPLLISEHMWELYILLYLTNIVGDSIQDITCRSSQFDISRSQINADGLNCMANDSRQVAETGNDGQHLLQRLLCLQIDFCVLIA